MRVVGGDSEYEGKLEVCFNQRWGTVNGDGWSSVDTQVTCRQLGYESNGECIAYIFLSVYATPKIHYVFNTVVFMSILCYIMKYITLDSSINADISFSLTTHQNVLSTPIVMNNVACFGSETKLIECNYRKGTSGDDHSDDIWVNCDASSPDRSTEQSSSSTSVTVILLAVLLCISILVIIITVVAFLLYNHLKRRNVNIFSMFRIRLGIGER